MTMFGEGSFKNLFSLILVNDEANSIMYRFQNSRSAVIELNDFLFPFRMAREVTSFVELSRPLSYHVLYFHNKVGPQVLHETTNELPEELKYLIKKLMDFRNPEPFLYSIQAYTMLNYQFDIESPVARGKKEYLQITIVFDKFGMEDFDKFKKILLNIAKSLQMNKEYYKVLNNEQQKHEINGMERLPDVTDLKAEFLDNFRALNNHLLQNAPVPSSQLCASMTG